MSVPLEFCLELRKRLSGTQFAYVVACSLRRHHQAEIRISHTVHSEQRVTGAEPIEDPDRFSTRHLHEAGPTVDVPSLGLSHEGGPEGPVS